MKITIGHLYPDLLNLYGDRGNIQCLMKRCQWRGIEAETIPFELGDQIDFSRLDIVLLGGGSDREQMLVCEKLKEILEEKGERNVVLVDLSKEDWSEAVEDAFRYGKVVFASSTYNMEIFTPMRNLLLNLKEKNYQNKIVGLIENGTWAPNSAKCMKEILSTMKNIDIIEPVVTIKSRLSKENCLQLFEMADDLIKK